MRQGTEGIQWGKKKVLRQNDHAIVTSSTLVYYIPAPAFLGIANEV